MNKWWGKAETETRKGPQKSARGDCLKALINAVWIRETQKILEKGATSSPLKIQIALATNHTQAKATRKGHDFVWAVEDGLQPMSKCGLLLEGSSTNPERAC